MATSSTRNKRPGVVPQIHSLHQREGLNASYHLLPATPTRTEITRHADSPVVTADDRGYHAYSPSHAVPTAETSANRLDPARDPIGALGEQYHPGNPADDSKSTGTAERHRLAFAPCHGLDRRGITTGHHFSNRYQAASNHHTSDSWQTIHRHWRRSRPRILPRLGPDNLHPGRRH